MLIDAVMMELLSLKMCIRDSFWLALIVDEKSPEALPNLDFKIMQGNSLLEQYKGCLLYTSLKQHQIKSYRLMQYLAINHICCGLMRNGKSLSLGMNNS